MYTSWQQTNITEDNTNGTIGMFGTSDDKYYFYMKFTVTEEDAWENVVEPKTFRMLFQMGDTLSEWTGCEL